MLDHHDLWVLSSPASVLWINAQRHGRDITVHVRGDIDYLTAPELAHALDHAQRWVVAGGRLLVDLHQVPFLGIAGMNALNLASLNCGASEIAFSVIGTSAGVNRHFVLAGLAHCLDAGAVIGPRRHAGPTS